MALSHSRSPIFISTRYTSHPIVDMVAELWQIMGAGTTGRCHHSQVACVGNPVISIQARDLCRCCMEMGMGALCQCAKCEQRPVRPPSTEAHYYTACRRMSCPVYEEEHLPHFPGARAAARLPLPLPTRPAGHQACSCTCVHLHFARVCRASVPVFTGCRGGVAIFGHIACRPLKWIQTTAQFEGCEVQGLKAHETMVNNRGGCAKCVRSRHVSVAAMMGNAGQCARACSWILTGTAWSAAPRTACCGPGT